MEAEHWGLKGAELGVPGAMENLGTLCRIHGDSDMALMWYRRGAERGYADLMAKTVNFRLWAGEAGDDGVSESMLQLADLLAERSQYAEAEKWYRRGAELGDGRAAAALAAIASIRGDSAEAAAWSEQAASLALSNLSRNKVSIRAAYGEPAIRRHTEIMVAYGDYLAKRGEKGEARSWYQHAARFGDPNGGIKYLNHADQF